MLRQLIKKELHLQRPAFIILALFLVLALLLLALTPWREIKLTSYHVELGDLIWGLYLVLVGGGLVLGVPVTMGTQIVAEERKTGMWDWQMSLPCSRWKQLLVKLGFGGVVIGLLDLLLVPALLFALKFALHTER